jgi:hypothetical protein
LQVCELPHNVPLFLLLVFTQAERPVEHDVLPFSHALPVLQLRFGVQAPHTPELQYMFVLVPHVCPLLFAAIAQVPPDPEQSWHEGQDGREQQMEPTQLPLEHSPPLPHVEPDVFLSTQDVPLHRYPLAHWESEEQLMLRHVAELVH